MDGYNLIWQFNDVSKQFANEVYHVLQDIHGKPNEIQTMIDGNVYSLWLHEDSPKKSFLTGIVRGYLLAKGV